jgi:hypothetical protein
MRANRSRLLLYAVVGLQLVGAYVCLTATPPHYLKAVENVATALVAAYLSTLTEAASYE